MAESAEWSSVEPFDIDDGQLDGLRSQECFVLGVEWQMFADFCDKIKSGDLPDRSLKMVHAINVGRCKKIAWRRELAVIEQGWVNDDWIELKVGRR